MRRSIYISVLFALISFSGIAQPLALPEDGRVEIGGDMLYWRDNTKAMPFEEIQKLHFLALDSKTSPNFGFDRSAVFWFKFDVTNQSTQKDWLLEVEYSPLDKIDMYAQSDTAPLIHKICGDIFPISEHEIHHPQPVFSFTILPNETKTIYLRVETISSVQVPVVLWQYDQFFRVNAHIQIFNGLFYGAMLVMVLYQLFLFLSIRDKTTFFYVLTLLSMTDIVAFFQGYTFLYLYPEHPMLNDIFATFSGPVFIICSTFLTRAFLNLRRFSPWLDNLMLANMCGDVLISILMIVSLRGVSYGYHHYFILLHCMLALISAGYCFYRKYRPALYYLVAWVTILLAASGFTLSNLGFFPGYLSTQYTGLMIGCIFQMLFISFALGERWNNLMKENQKAKELELKRGLEENERLERVVKLRTEEIQQQRDKLEEAGRIKDKLFSVVSHDIKSPLNSLKIALILAHSGDISADEFKNIAVGLEAHLEKTTEFIQNLLHWAKLQLQGEAFEPQRLDLSELIEETCALLEMEWQKKNILVKRNIPDTPLIIHADTNMIQSVLRNLLTNAIKFTPPGGTIVISAKNISGQFIISISDTGVGIHASRRNQIFTLESITTLGTQQESGTGLGLVLCKEFIEKNNGRIWFESEENKGTTFYFSLPEFQEVQEQVQISLES